MRSRSLVLVLALLVLSLGAIGAAQRDASQRDDTSSTTTPATTAAAQVTPPATTTTTTTTTTPTGAATTKTTTTDATGGLEANAVSGTLPRDHRVEAEIGDTVQVTVTSEVPDIVEVLDLGISSAVGPDIPAMLSFTADAAGTFPVTYEVAGKEAGVIVVR